MPSQTMEHQTQASVLILGASGQLGSNLVQLLQAQASRFDLHAFSSAEVDFTQEQVIEQCVNDIQPDIVINAAAYTQVDRAEQEPEHASIINGQAVERLVQLAKQISFKLIHISTDYVFSGYAAHHQLPTDATGPCNHYGASKLAGEQALLQQTDVDWVCLRTAWVYSNTGHNFLNTMLKHMQAHKPLKVIYNQIGTPTSALSLARAVLACIAHPSFKGLHHWTDAGVASWYDFAIAIQEEALALGILTQPTQIDPIPSSEYPTPAKRPTTSLLSKESAIAGLGMTPVHWREALREVLQQRIS